MTIKNILFLIILLTSAPVSNAQTCAAPFLGSKTLYTGKQQSYAAIPKGYHTVFINHVGRHGARHLTKDAATTYIFQSLMQADSINGLTADGKLLKEKVLRLQKVEKNNFKSISGTGKDEQHLIAERMFTNNKEVFGEAAPVLNVAVTKEIRTTQTSDAFLEGLKAKINPPVITRKVNDTTLRFYDLSPAYLEYEEKGSWIALLDQIKKDYKYDALAKQVSQRFFTPAFLQRMNEKDKDRFTSDLYGFITIFYSIGQEIEANGFKKNEVDMESFMTCSQLEILGKINDAEDFLVKGPGTAINGIQVKIAVPLLADFINTTDDYIKNKSINAQLRFTHAEAISPFTALMEIKNASEPVKNIAVNRMRWKAANVICLSANIQWILCKKEGSDNYLIKFLLNEKEVAINGLSTKTYPYYKWNDVRTFYLSKLKSLGSSVTQNGLQYLKDVK